MSSWNTTVELGHRLEWERILTRIGRLVEHLEVPPLVEQQEWQKLRGGRESRAR